MSADVEWSLSEQHKISEKSFRGFRVYAPTPKLTLHSVVNMQVRIFLDLTMNCKCCHMWLGYEGQNLMQVSQCWTWFHTPKIRAGRKPLRCESATHDNKSCCTHDEVSDRTAGSRLTAKFSSTVKFPPCIGKVAPTGPLNKVGIV